MTHDLPSPESGEAAPAAPLRDAEVRAIAARLVQEHRTPPPANPDRQLAAQRYELSPADEERVDAAVVALLGLPPESTLRAEREAGPEADGSSTEGPEGIASDLARAIARNRRRFLDTEIAIGNTMLDAAAVTQLPAVHARRVARAEEAHDEVARHLAGEAHPALPAVDRTALADGLVRLRARLDGAG